MVWYSHSAVFFTMRNICSCRREDLDLIYLKISSFQTFYRVFFFVVQNLYQVKITSKSKNRSFSDVENNKILSFKHVIKRLKFVLHTAGCWRALRRSASSTSCTSRSRRGRTSSSSSTSWPTHQVLESQAFGRWTLDVWKHFSFETFHNGTFSDGTFVTFSKGQYN